MDLWRALARLRARPVLLALVVALAGAFGTIGWAFTAPSFSISTAQVIQVRAEGGQQLYSAGSFELGIIASMVARNLDTVGTGVPGAMLTVDNSVIAPPAMLPLITMTVMSSDEEGARKAVRYALVTNQRFLSTIMGPGSQLQLVHVNPTHPPVESSQPRIRAAASGLILGLLFGTLALLGFDTLIRARSKLLGNVAGSEDAGATAAVVSTR